MSVEQLGLKLPKLGLGVRVKRLGSHGLGLKGLGLRIWSLSLGDSV